MNIVSIVWTWYEDHRLYTRLTTNVCSERLLARLKKLNLLEHVETIHSYFGDRVDGGFGYEVLWKTSIEMGDIREELRRL